MVTHHTASLITAKPSARSQSPACSSRPVVSRIAVSDQSSAPVSAGVSLAWWRFQATRQRAEQNRACSRRGANTAPHCSQFLMSAIGHMLRVTTGAGAGRRRIRLPSGQLPFIFRSFSGRLSVALAR